MIQQNELTIRLMNHHDFHLMVKWLNDERVLKFYEEPPTDLDRVNRKYGPRVDGEHYVTPCIIEYRDNPIGYMQYYEIQETELITYGYMDEQNIYGIDQFIGETELWDKGIGTKMIQLMLDYLCENGASKVVLEVKSNNCRAISSYTKCGFKRIKELNNDLVLMEWIDPSNSTKWQLIE